MLQPQKCSYESVERYIGKCIFAVLLCSFLCPEQHVEVSGYLVYCRVVSLFNDFVGKTIIIPNRT